MGIFSDKQKEIVVDVKDDRCIWSIPLDGVAYDASLVVHPGAVAVYIQDGAESHLSPGTKYVINRKKDRKEVTDRVLLGAATGREIGVPFGVGPVDFKDHELGVDGTVGVNADVSVRINSPMAVYKACGNRDLTDRDVAVHLRTVCASLLKAELTKVLQYSTYEEIAARLERNKENLETALDKALVAAGVLLVRGSLKIGGLKFSDDYLEARKRVHRAHLDAAIAKDEGERAAAELKSLEKAKEIFGAKAKPTAAFCPICGAKVPADATVCPICGKKI